jgi:hypothetical protein
MALLKPEFMRSHPVKAGMFWATPLLLSSLLGSWLFGQFNAVFVTTASTLWILGGLAWGFAMKSYHDRFGDRQ